MGSIEKNLILVLFLIFTSSCIGLSVIEENALIAFRNSQPVLQNVWTGTPTCAWFRLVCGVNDELLEL